MLLSFTHFLKKCRSKLKKKLLEFKFELNINKIKNQENCSKSY